MVKTLPADGGGSGTTHAEQTAIDTAVDTFNDYAAQFDNTLTPLGTCHDNITSGMGEFAEHVATGNAKFLLGWRETFTACSETAGIIAGNTGDYMVDLTDVDVDQSITVTI